MPCSTDYILGDQWWLVSVVFEPCLAPRALTLSDMWELPWYSTGSNWEKITLLDGDLTTYYPKTMNYPYALMHCEEANCVYQGTIIKEGEVVAPIGEYTVTNYSHIRRVTRNGDKTAVDDIVHDDYLTIILNALKVHEDVSSFDEKDMLGVAYIPLANRI